MVKARSKVLIVLCTLLLVIGLLLWWISSHGFSARERPSAIETILARGARRLATPAGVRGMVNSVTKNELSIAEARDHFADHCAICHANDGSGKTAINEGLYPAAPDLRDRKTQDLSDGELFYIIRNGVRFTGMPGWGGEDEENWKLVHFIRHLPNISEKELELMKEVNNLEIGK